MSQQWNAAQYARTAAFVPALGAFLLDRLDPRPGERILDIGCGDGVLTEQIALRGASVVGIDSSPQMAAAARARGLDARVMNVERLQLDGVFDAAFSNAVLHWVNDHDAALAAIAAHLKPGGRFVGELGGHGNVAAIVTAIAAALRSRGLDFGTLTPWRYPTADEFRAVLERTGFRADEIMIVPRPTRLDAGMLEWLKTFAGAFAAAVPPEDREPMLQEIVDVLRHGLCDREGAWTADYVRLRFAATRRA